MASTLLLLGPPAAGKSTVGLALLSRGRVQVLLELDQVRFLAGQVRLPWSDSPSHGYSPPVLQTAARARRAAGRGQKAVLIDDYADADDVQAYRHLLRPFKLITVLLSLSEPEHLQRNHGRPPKRRLPRQLLGTLREQAIAGKWYDHVVDTNSRKADEVADQLGRFLS